LVNDEIHLFLMHSARLAVKFFPISFPEFAKSMQNRVQCKVSRFTCNSVCYGNQRPDCHTIQISGIGPGEWPFG